MIVYQDQGESLYQVIETGTLLVYGSTYNTWEAELLILDDSGCYSVPLFDTLPPGIDQDLIDFHIALNDWLDIKESPILKSIYELRYESFSS